MTRISRPAVLETGHPPQHQRGRDDAGAGRDGQSGTAERDAVCSTKRSASAGPRGFAA